MLVTGASGFIGRALVAALADSGVSVRGLGRRMQAGDWWQADLAESASLRGCCREIDAVLHLAGVAHTRTPQARHEAVTVAGTRALVTEARSAGVRRFVFVSSIKAECSDDDYARSRRRAEACVREAGFESAVCVRPGLVYGPGVGGNLARLWRCAAWPIPLPWPRGGAVRALIHRDDLVAVLRALLVIPPGTQTYTVTDGHPYTLHEIYSAMRLARGRRISPFGLPRDTFARLARCGDRLAAVTHRSWPWDSQALAPLLESCFSADRRVWQDLGLEPRQTLATALPAWTASC